jgi:protein-tyrosine-phosphatase
VGGSRTSGKEQVLFPCTNNPAGSQMAEVFRLARDRLRDLIGMDLANGKGR